MGRDAPTEEKGSKMIANNVYSLFAIQSEEYKKAMIITGQNTTEILFKYSNTQ